MKIIRNIFDIAISYESLWAAFDAIRRDNNKKHRKRIKAFSKHLYENLMALHNALKNGTWHMHEYRHITRLEGRKLREIWYSHDFGDMIVQRALCMTIGVLLNKSLIKDTYAGIPGKSMHKAVRKLWRRIKSLPKDSRVWCYKCDIKQFYMSIDHDVLKQALVDKIKDKRMLKLLFGIIDSSPFPVGLPIGNMMSTVFANYYLNAIDRMAQSMDIVYFRYNDDIVVISTDKDKVRDFRTAIHSAVKPLLLTIKPNDRLFTLDNFGLDYVGYIIQTNRILIRRCTERKLRRRYSRFYDNPSMHVACGVVAYWGWCKRSKSGHVLWYVVTGVCIDHFNAKAIRLCVCKK